jgi:hypothetical protein
MNLLLYPLGVLLDSSLVVLKQCPGNYATLTWWKYKVTGTMAVMSTCHKIANRYDVISMHKDHITEDFIELNLSIMLI